MRSFEELWEIAAERQGGTSALEARLAERWGEDLRQAGDDRWLAIFTRSIFQAGFNWKVIEAMWPGFEEVFHGFDIGRAAMLAGEDFDRLVADKRIVRNGTKIRSIQENAVFLQELAAEHGSAGACFFEWPGEDYVGLLAMLKKRGARLGGMSAQYALRHGGVDSFILSRDVTARLVAEGVVDKAPSSAKAMAAVQGAFNAWRTESGRGLTDISRVLAMSV